MSHGNGLDEIISETGDKSTKEVNWVEPQMINESVVFDSGALRCDRQKVILEQGG